MNVIQEGDVFVFQTDSIPSLFTGIKWTALAGKLKAMDFVESAIWSFTPFKQPHESIRFEI